MFHSLILLWITLVIRPFSVGGFTSTCTKALKRRMTVGKFVHKNSLSKQIVLKNNHALFVLSPSDAWEAYNAALVTDPLLVKSVTAGVILGAADFAGQAFENSALEDKKDVDFGRAVRFAFFGLVLQAPWNHFYYMLLDGQIPPTDDPFSATNIVKVCIDQFVQAPIFTILIFAFLGVLEGKALSSIKQQLDNDYKDTMIANCTF
jgi:hypothetical protein